MKPGASILTELGEIAPQLGLFGAIEIPYRVPAGYFEYFVDILNIRIQQEMLGMDISPADELARLSPLLSGLQKKNPYQVPAGFFENVKLNIPEPEKIHPEVRKISTPAPIRRISLPMRIAGYAAAASIVALLGIAIFNTGNHQNTVDPIQGLTNVSDQDMANFMESNDVHWTPGITSAPTDMASADFTDNDIHELLSNVSDVELEQYSSTLPEEKRSVN